MNQKKVRFFYSHSYTNSQLNTIVLDLTFLFCIYRYSIIIQGTPTYMFSSLGQFLTIYKIFLGINYFFYGK